MTPPPVTTPTTPSSTTERADEGGDPPCWDGLVADHRDANDAGCPADGCAAPANPAAAAGTVANSVVTDGLPDLDTPTRVHDLVIAFYREIVFDPVLAPVFEDAEVDWSLHIPHLIDYWCKILLGATTGYVGNTTRSHRALHQVVPIDATHCERWFTLWVTSIDTRWAGPTADHAKRHAEAIMAGLAKHVFDVPWPTAAG